MNPYFKNDGNYINSSGFVHVSDRCGHIQKLQSDGTYPSYILRLFYK